MFTGVEISSHAGFLLVVVKAQKRLKTAHANIPTNHVRRRARVRVRVRVRVRDRGLSVRVRVRVNMQLFQQSNVRQCHA